MKRLTALALAILVCLGALFAGCTPIAGSSPDQNKEVRWITYDYSFCINPADDCKGYYTFNDVRYNIQVKFEGSRLTAVDLDNNNTELFAAEWMYEKSDSGSDMLYICNIDFNKEAYPDFESNLAEYTMLKQEKL